MKPLSFPHPFSHDHPQIENVNKLFEQQLSSGQKAADRVAALVGSWPFIIIQSSLLVIWVILSITVLIQHWDPYPFILMKLVLSLQAAFTAPFIMMSQNLQSEKDHLKPAMILPSIKIGRKRFVPF